MRFSICALEKHFLGTEFDKKIILERGCNLTIQIKICSGNFGFFFRLSSPNPLLNYCYKTFQIN